MGKPDGFWIGITSAFHTSMALYRVLYAAFIYINRVRGISPKGRCREATEGSRLRLRKRWLGSAESDEGLTYPGDLLNKECNALPCFSVNVQPHRVSH